VRFPFFGFRNVRRREPGGTPQRRGTGDVRAAAMNLLHTSDRRYGRLVSPCERRAPPLGTRLTEGIDLRHLRA
jgi:hypothetical protein